MRANPPLYLRTHSYYSILESLLSPRRLVDLAKDYHLPALALTDYRYLTGSLEFYLDCVNAGIKPIIGLEVDLSVDHCIGRLTLLAKNKLGWTNLCKLSSKALIDNQPIQFNFLTDHCEGLICLIGGHNGILRQIIQTSPNTQHSVSKLLSHLKSLFANACYMEIQRYADGPLINETDLTNLACDHHLPLVASQKIHYSSHADRRTFRTIAAIRNNTLIQNLTVNQLPDIDLSFPEPEVFMNRFNDLPAALDNLDAVQSDCNLELPIGKTQFPVFPTPKDQSQSDYLRTLAYQGAREKYGQITDLVRDRLEHELSTITTMNYEPIFLIVQDILKQASKLGIPTSSRGSAASSLVAHCLGITSPDPIALDLYFERFLNPARKKPPDIDTDIASHRRDEIIHYVFDTYGEDRVAMVGTINRYRPKSAFGDVAKAYGISPNAIRQFSKKITSSYRFQSEDESDAPFASLMEGDTTPMNNEIIADARAILDFPRHLSVHPGGIVLAPFSMTDLIPLTHSPTMNINHTQFDLDGVDQFGLVKIDLLGIRGLTVLGEVANRIRTWRSREFSSGLDVLQRIPKFDEPTAAAVAEGKTIGCFQIESPGMRATLQEINARSVDDIMHALALYRPGPLRGGLRDAFVRRFRNEEPITHIHESLASLLDSTYGVILYQEQVLMIAHEIGGLSISEADILRRAMSHFDPGDLTITLREKFIHAAINNKNIPRNNAEQIWDMMAAFAGYGFPKAHAASYAQLAWNSAWCKTHYPAEFMAAVLGYGGGYYSQSVYLTEAKRLGLEIRPPHINHSGIRFIVAYPQGEPILYMGLGQVRDLTQKTISEILQKRPFHSFEDFLTRVAPRRKEARHLIQCAALDGLISIPQGLAELNHQRLPGQMALFSSNENQPDWDDQQRSKAQEEILGVSLTVSPLDRYAEQIQSAGAISTYEASIRPGEKVRVAGMRQAFRRLRTKSNEMMGYLNLEDLEGSLQVIIPPRILRKYHNLIKKPGPFIIDGIIETDDNQKQVSLVAKIIHLLDQS